MGAPRKECESEIYHVISRGTGRQLVFEDNEDRNFFIDLLVRYAGKASVEIYAWCLMGNHIHLLLHAPMARISECMKRLCGQYAQRFNTRHGRVGHLFQARFRSEPVADDPYLITVVSYIHYNPQRSNLASQETYRWSSYGEYFTNVPNVCKIDFALSLFGGIEHFLRFHEPQRDQMFLHERIMDVGTSGPMKDDEARNRANAALATAGFPVSASQIGTLSRNERDRALACVKRVVGCSLRQLQRLTALAYSAIRLAAGVLDKNNGEKCFDSDFTAFESRTAELMKPFETLVSPSLAHSASSSRALPLLV